MLVQYGRYFRTGYHPVSRGSIVFLGCSFMWAEALPRRASVPYKVSERTGLHCQNFAVPGAGPQLVRAIADQLDLTRALAVVIAWPGPLREHYWREGQLECYGPWVTGEHRLCASPNYSVYKQRLVSGQVLECNQRAREITLGVPLLQFDFRQFAQGFHDLAEDNSHPGVRTQSRVASGVVAWLEFNRLIDRGTTPQLRYHAP